MLQVVKARSAASEPNKEANPVEALWEVELLYGKHPDYTENTYAVKFTTRLEGNASKSYLVIELRERFDEILRELNVFGVLEKPQLHRVIDYVTQLKISGSFKRVNNLLSVMEGKVSVDEGYELYSLIIDSVLSEPDAYPTVSSDLYKHGESAGVVLDSEQYTNKFGANAVGVTTEALIDIFGLEGSMKNKRLLEITRGLKDMDLLIYKSKQNRLQEAVRPNISSKEAKRLYIFQVEGLGQ